MKEYISPLITQDGIDDSRLRIGVHDYLTVPLKARDSFSKHFIKFVHFAFTFLNVGTLSGETRKEKK